MPGIVMALVALVPLGALYLAPMSRKNSLSSPFFNNFKCFLQ
jgi:hypothetical protein